MFKNTTMTITHVSVKDFELSFGVVVDETDPQHIF